VEAQRIHLNEITPNRIANFGRAFCNLRRSKDYESRAKSTTFSLGESTGRLCSIPFLKLAIRAGASFANPLTLLSRDKRVETGSARDRKNRVFTLGKRLLAKREV
jgi:hypothetical protein